MGDQFTPLSLADARHLLRRSGFGGSESQAQAYAGMTRGQAADQLRNFRPTRFRPAGRDLNRMRNAWLKYMIKVPLQLQEKLVLFWHDHFATGDAKVQDKDRMANQNKLLRQSCKGDFRAFVKTIGRNAAMMVYLDTVENFKDQPNENYARELMELFTLGVRDLAGNANYAQEDIVQIARAFSGWNLDNKDHAVFNDYDHDFLADFLAERGPKVIFKTRGQFAPLGGGRDYTQPQGEGAGEIDRVVDILFEHRDTDNKNTVARFIAKKLIEYFAHPLPAYPGNAAIIDPIVQRSGFDTSFDIGALVREIFVDDYFFQTAGAAPMGAPKSVKWPIDYVVGMLRLLNVKVRGRPDYVYIDGGSYSSVSDLLESMGQILFDPPSVFGWDWETAWLSSATLLARYDFARNVISARGTGKTHFRPERMMATNLPSPVPIVNLTDPGQIVDAVLNQLGMTGQFTAGERQAFIDYLGGPLDLTDYDNRNRKLHGLFGLVLQSPQFQVH